MTGPGGTQTNRDRRREQRRNQYVQAQAGRRAERQRMIRQRRIQRYSIIAGAIVVVLLLALAISQFVFHAHLFGAIPALPVAARMVEAAVTQPHSGTAASASLGLVLTTQRISWHTHGVDIPHAEDTGAQALIEQQVE